MLNNLLIFVGKTLSQTFRLLNLGDGSTWPGHIALKANKNIIQELLKRSRVKIILIAGTNGKTTTSTLIKTTLEKNGKKVFQNESGANLVNGIASTLILHADHSGKLHYDFAIFEIDENALPLILKQVTPDYLILLNLFRDQLDRYGEINIITEKWAKALTNLSEKSTIILNADDPQIVNLGIKTQAQKRYFGLTSTTKQQKDQQHAADSVYCPNCGEKLVFTSLFFSHLGDWQCKKCGLKRPELTLNKAPINPLQGTYNLYNTLAATIVLKEVGLTDKEIETGYKDFQPAFGRQETVMYKNKKIQFFLSKNPTSFNQSYATIKDLKATTLLIVLNDRIPDGQDISWIWDVDLPEIQKFKHILVAGDRVYDIAVRIKYEGFEAVESFENLEEAIDIGISYLKDQETLYILPTYSAMLESRKIVTGKKIL